MAVDTVIIKITGDSKDIEKTIAKLERVGKVDKQNAKSFKKSSKQFQDQQTKNISSVDKLAKQALSLGPILLGAFAIGSLTSFVKELSGTAVQMEAFEKRAKVVFGNSVKFVEDFAKENAKNLGLSENAFIGAAAAVGDILVPLGLSRDRAAEMSAEAVKLGSALREFTGDQRSAAEISEVVAKSFTGEVEGLKGLGVVINQNDKDFKALVKTKIVTLGLTEQQAKAEAIFETVLAKSSDALSSFETNTDSAARQQAIFDANTEELIESLAVGYLPILTASLKAINSLSESTQDLAKELIKENEAFEKQEKEVTTLVSRYEELTTQTDLNSDEQEELRNIIEDLAERVPQAATEFDKYGNALDINTEKVIANLKQQENILRLRNAETIKEIREEIEGFTKDVTENTRVLNKGFVTTTTFSKTQKVLIEDIELTASEIRKLRNENILLNADSAELLLTLEGLGIELTELEKEFIDAALGTNRFKEAVEETTEATADQVRNVFFLKNAISALQKEQQAQATTLGRVAQITKEIIPLQAELNRLLGKESSKEADAALQRRIDLLSLFQDEVIKTTSLIEAQIAQQIALNAEAVEEEEEFAAEGADFRIAQFQKTMDGRRQALEIELRQEKISQEEFNESIAELDKEAADNKIKQAQRAAEVGAAISNAAFNLLLAQQDKKLQLLDNETTIEIRNLQERRDENLITEEEFAEKREQIEKEAEEERRRLLRKRAELAKTAALIDATINTAIAVTKALETSVPFAALVAALGAAEIAVIASQPIPEFHEGKKPELKEGEIFAKVLKTESVIPPEQSKKYKGVIDSMIDGNLEKYVFEKYTLPMIKSASNTSTSTPFNDMNLWNEQRRQSKLLNRSNQLTERMLGMMDRGNAWRTWR